jgi:hypothetical protein
VDARGTPLGVVVLSGANRHDSRMLTPTLDAVPPVRSGRRGPAKLHAGKGDDHRRCRRECRERGVSPASRRGVEDGERRPEAPYRRALHQSFPANLHRQR